MTIVEDSRKVVLVTGGSRGIGLAAAQGFLRDGYRVAAFSRGRAGALEEAAARGDALLLAGDIARIEDVNACVAATLARFGRIDVLFNNSATQLVANFIDEPIEKWLRVIDVNVTGLAAMTHAVLPTMIEAGYGRIVNMVSRAPERAKENLTAYASSKAAVVTFTRCLAAEFRGPDGPDIRVNSLIPGVTATAMMAELGWDLSMGQPPEAIYPYIRQLAELPRDGPTGQVYWDGAIYKMYDDFLEAEEPSIDQKRITVTRNG